MILIFTPTLSRAQQRPPFAHLIYHSADIYAAELYTPELDFKTYYETQHLADARTIKYVRIELGNENNGVGHDKYITRLIFIRMHTFTARINRSSRKYRLAGHLCAYGC
jgi:hypothetical protein